MPPAIHTHEALYGGNPEQLSFVDPLGIMRALGTLRDESAKKGWQIEVTMEATHHGPTSFKIPVVFVEIGSGPLEWSDSTLGEKGAKAAMAAANPLRSSTSNAVGFGGTHIQPNTPESVWRANELSDMSYLGIRVRGKYQALH